MPQVTAWRDCRDARDGYITSHTRYWENVDWYIADLKLDAWDRFSDKWFDKTEDTLAKLMTSAVPLFSCTKDINTFINDNLRLFKKWVQIYEGARHYQYWDQGSGRVKLNIKVTGFNYRDGVVYPILQLSWPRNSSYNKVCLEAVSRFLGATHYHEAYDGMYATFQDLKWSFSKIGNAANVLRDELITLHMLNTGCKQSFSIDYTYNVAHMEQL